jgi:DNA-binding HxlR family transcriptional regulator
MNRRPAPTRQPAPSRTPAADEAGAQRGPLAAALSTIGDRWTLLVIDALLGGSRRFGDLAAAVPGIATNVLSQRLRRLEAEGVVLASAYSERPRRVVYALSAPGKELAGALRLLAAWGSQHVEGAEPVRHQACGTPLEPRWYCPTCAVLVDDPEAQDLHFA